MFLILIIIVSIEAFASWAVASEPWLENPGFESADPPCKPVGWRILTGLDEAGYGPPEHGFQFDAVVPARVSPGRGGRGYALGFPSESTWQCAVRHHDQGMIKGREGTSAGLARGKAAACQTVALAPGRYRFGAYLRTAGGDPWSGAFSLGYAVNGTTDYAHDGGTGIVWTTKPLAMRGDPNGDYTEWGEWQWCQTPPFTLSERTEISVWIRFDYVNQHQTNVRWEADDAAIVPVEREETAPLPLAAGKLTEGSSVIREDIRDFRLEVEMPSDVAVLHIGFRRNPEGSDGYLLQLTSQSVVLTSIRDGLLYAGGGYKWPYPLRASLLVRGQYCRVDLPDHRGFECRLIGPGSGCILAHCDGLGGVPSYELMPARSAMPSLPVPRAGEFSKVYDPSVGEGEAWYINDHCLIRDDANIWHMFGITHAEPASPLDEDFLAHATTPALMQTPWRMQPYVCPVNTPAGETHVWAPHIVRRDDTYYMFYCGGGESGDAYQINLRTSKDLKEWIWHAGNPLFTDIGDARDPMILRPGDGTYLMYYTRPSGREDRYSGVAVRESTDLIHWSPPSMALVTHHRNHAARLTESPYVFEHDGAYYLSATGLYGYRGTVVWRSLNPRRFDPDQWGTRINAHAPEWIRSDDGPVDYVTHCGWKQGGLWLAPVTWHEKAWDTFGLLVLRTVAFGGPHIDKDRIAADDTPPRIVEIRRYTNDREPYRRISINQRSVPCALPPGRYSVSVLCEDKRVLEPTQIEVVADERTYLDVP